MYSFGLVLAEALAGKALDMGGTQAQILDKRRRVPDLSGVDARIRPLLTRMLAPDPADRLADMAEVAAWQPKTAIPAPPKRSLPLRAVAGLAVAALLAGGGFYLWTALTPGIDAGRARPPGDVPPSLSEPRETPAPASSSRPRRRSSPSRPLRQTRAPRRRQPETPAATATPQPPSSPQLAVRTDPPPETPAVRPPVQDPIGRNPSGRSPS